MGGMKLSSYIKGRRLEYRVRDLFKKNGFIVIRAARSMPTDLVCLRDGESLFIECKARKSEFGEEKKKELLNLAGIAGARPILAYRHKRKIYLMDAQTNNSLLIEDI